MKQKNSNKGKIAWALGLTVGGIAICIFVIIMFLNNWLSNYTHHDDYVRVPTVTGITFDQATYIIEAAGLVPMVIDSVYTDARPGAVIEQLPEGDLPVKLGRIVYLTINATTRQMVRMINVQEWSSRQAASRLQELGFVIDSIAYEPYQFDDLVLKVTAGSQILEEGVSLPIHTHITLHVGSTNIQVPDSINTTDTTEQGWFE